MATIAITDIVDKIDGTGIFDVLMTAMELRLDEQYDRGRIKGGDYASVYLGLSQSVLQQAIAYTLGVQSADKQADLIAEQIIASTATTVRNDANATQERAVGAEQVTASTATTTRNDSIAVEQIDKLQAEEALLLQKKFTEDAQILDTVNAASVLGIIGKQKTLYENQANGFTRDAEQKAMKAFTDVWTVAKSTSPDDLELALPLNADQHSMDVMLAKLAIGAGLVTVDTELGTQSLEFTTHTITGATDPGAAEVSITVSATHNMSTGDAVYISGVTGMTELNGNNYIITDTGATTFTLDGTDGVTFSAYTAGGTVKEL